MTNNISPSARAYVSLPSSSPSVFQTQSYIGHPNTFCPRCTDYANALTSLQTHLAMLDLKLLKAEEEKAEAQYQACHILGLNEAAVGEATATDLANRDDLELRRSLFLANTEKNCMKIMLERAWKKIADLSLSGASNPGSKPCLVTDLLQDTEDLLLDLVGPSELPSSAQGLNDLSSLVTPYEQVEEIESIAHSTDDGKVEVSAQHDANLESDTVSDTSYIFHFVREHDGSHYSRDEEKILMKVSKSTSFSNIGN